MSIWDRILKSRSPKRSIYLDENGKPKSIIATGKGVEKGQVTTSSDRTEALLRAYRDYYEGENTVFAAINTTAWNTIMVGYNIISEDKNAKLLIRQYLNKLNLESVFLDSVIFALVYGDSFVEIIKNSKDDVTGLKNVDPITMNVLFDKFGTTKGYQQKIGGKLQSSILKPEDIIHLKFFSKPSSPYGLSLIEPSKETIDRKVATDEAISNAFRRHGCYDDKTEILTEDGWKLFKDLNRKEKVATYNPEKESLEYRLPKDYVEYDWKGKLDSYQGKFIDLVTTPDHDHYVSCKRRVKNKWLWTNYEKTNKINHYAFKFKSFVENYEGEKNYPPEQFSDWNIKQFLQFMGLYISEGSLHHDKEMVIHQSESSPHLQLLQNELNHLPLECHEVIRDRYIEYKPAHEFRFYSANIGRYLKPLGKHNSKYIPKEFKNLPKKYLSVLFEYLMIGDGHNYDNDLKYYYTTSKRLADDVQEIALKLGYSSSISIRDRDKENWKISYEVRCRKHKGMEPTYNKGKIQKIDYDGKVYCVRVPNHLFFVRRNGKVIISGNTPKYKVKVGTAEEIPPPAIFTDIKNELEDITELNEIILPGLVDIEVIDEKGVPGVEEMGNVFQTQLVVGMLCPEEALGQGKGILYPNTEILVKGKGYIPIYEVKEGDTIMTYNKNINSLEWQRNIRTWEYDLKEDLFSIEAQTFNLLCTQDHRVLYRGQHKKDFEICQAQELPSRFEMIVGGMDWIGKDIDYEIIPSVPRLYGNRYIKGKIIGEYPEKKIPIDLWLRFLGYYISEGCTTISSDNSYSVKIKQMKDDGLNKIYNDIKDLPFKINRYEDCLIINDKQLGMYLYPLGKSYEKYIFNHIKELSKDKLSILYECLMFGDGCQNNYFTSSKQLSDDVQEIILKMGYGSSIYARDRIGKEVIINGKVSGKTNFIQYTITRNEKNLTPEICIKETNGHKDMHKLIPYEGKAYCVTVENGFILSRLNGKCVVTGNSTEATAKIKEVMYERFVKSIQTKISNQIRTELINPILEKNRFELDTVYIKFNSVTDADEAVKSKWLGNILRGFPEGKIPFTINEIRHMFDYPPVEGGDDLFVINQPNEEEENEKPEKEPPKKPKPKPKPEEETEDST